MIWERGSERGSKKPIFGVTFLHVLKGITINLHLQRTLDADDELGRLEKEVQNLEDELQSTESRLAEWNGRLEKVLLLLFVT